VDRRATGGSRAGAGLSEREAGGPRGFGAQSNGNTEPPQRLTCPIRAGNTARIGEKTRRGRSAHCAPRVDDTAEALFVTRSCSSSKGTGLVIGQHQRGTRTGSPVRANANERRLAERGRKTDANARREKVPRACPKPRTVHAAWWKRPRPSGRPEVAAPKAHDCGPTPVDTAPPGVPAGRRGIRGTPARRLPEKTTLRTPSWLTEAGSTA
jgi:hypothetical protein